jgi:hypothetical protein
MRSHLSVRGQAAPVLDAPLRYRATANPYQAVVLQLELHELVYAIDWLTKHPDGPALHTLIVPAVVMTSLGLDQLEGFDALLDVLDTAGWSVQSTTRRDFPTSDDPVALTLGLPPGTSLHYESQLLKADDHHPLALEIAYSVWLDQ